MSCFRALLAAAAVTALAGCDVRPQARAFDTSFKGGGDGPVALMGGPEAAGDHARAAYAEVNGFQLTDAAPAATEAPAATATTAATDGPNGFELLAAAPQAQTAPAAMAQVAPEPQAPPVELAGGPAEAITPPPAPVHGVRPAAHRARPATRPLAEVALMQTPAAPVVSAAPRAEAPAPPAPPAGGAEMFAACVLAAGALWRWHKQCLKAVEHRPAPRPLLLPALEAWKA